MSTQRKPQAPPMDETTVADFLKTEPQFFQRHPNLLPLFDIPHPSGRAVSLIERQVSILREQNERLKHRLEDMVRNGRENQRLMERLHELTMVMMEADDLCVALDILHKQLHSQFQADVVSLHLANAPETVMERGLAQAVQQSDGAFVAFASAFRSGRAVCGRLRTQQREMVFGETAVASAALVPLGEAAAHGVVGIGSHDPDHFHHAADTLILRQLGAVIVRVLQRHGVTGAARA